MKTAPRNTVSRRDLSIIEGVFRPIYGRPCWGVNYERYLNLSLHFGPPHLIIREPHSTASQSSAVRRNAARRLVTVGGRWWLWIFTSYWRLSYNGVVISNQRRYDSGKVRNMLCDLEGQKLIRVRVNPKNSSTRFEFDLGAKLDVWKLDDDTVYDLLDPLRQFAAARVHIK